MDNISNESKERTRDGLTNGDKGVYIPISINAITINF
jgi:hypothetical protein